MIGQKSFLIVSTIPKSIKILKNQIKPFNFVPIMILLELQRFYIVQKKLVKRLKVFNGMILKQVSRVILVIKEVP